MGERDFSGSPEEARDRSRYRRSAPLSSEAPTNPVRPHQPADLVAELPFEHRPPRHQCEFPRLLDECEPAAGEIDASGQPTLDNAARPRLDERLAQLGGELLPRTDQLPALKEQERVGAKTNRSPVCVGELLLDQPLPARVERGTHLASETSIAHRQRCRRADLPIEPCRGICRFQPGER